MYSLANYNYVVAVIGHWFDKRRALATGVACTAGGIGGVVFLVLILYLTPTLGFAWSIRVIALLCAVVLAVACVTLRKRRRPGIKTSGGGGGGVGGGRVDVEEVLMR
ncbi:hypothetical protein MY1884_007537 [Beauveria asiatica]